MKSSFRISVVTRKRNLKFTLYILYDCYYVLLSTSHQRVQCVIQVLNITVRIVVPFIIETSCRILLHSLRYKFLFRLVLLLLLLFFCYSTTVIRENFGAETNEIIIIIIKWREIFYKGMLCKHLNTFVCFYEPK